MNSKAVQKGLVSCECLMSLRVCVKRILKYLWLIPCALASAYADSRPLFFDVIDYSPFRGSQAPWGAQPSYKQIQDDIRMLKPYTHEVRLYSMGGTTDQILEVCMQEGMGVHLQAWLGPEHDDLRWKRANENQVKALIWTANQYARDPEKRNLIKSLIVGSENLYRRDLQGGPEMEESELIEYIKKVKEETKDTLYPVTTAQTYPEYSAKLAGSVDRILYHVHPFWEGLPIEEAADRVVETLRLMKRNLKAWEDAGLVGASEKPVFIGETGWPTQGENHGRAVPSEENQRLFLEDLNEKLARYHASEDSRVQVMYFDAFDEAWKGSQEGNVGGYWGLFTAERQPKLGMSR